MSSEHLVSLEHKPEIIEKVGTPLTFRPDVRVLDCTVRDGGLVTNFSFSDDMVRALYLALAEAGVDYMEVGYKASKKIFSPEKFGKWKFSTEEDIRKVLGDRPEGPKLSVMADAERTDYHTDILPKSESVVDLVRIATYVHQLPTALDMIKDAKDKGYETAINLMAASTVNEHELEEAIGIFADSDVDIIYLVDSFGSFYSEITRDYVNRYMVHARKGGKKLGIHAHNNQQLAFSNTIEALIMGTSYVDTTVYGLGRGAGNCHTELMLGFLKNPKYHVRPLLKVIDEYVAPLKKSEHWGFDIPYMLTGQFNVHPQPAIKYINNPDGTYTDFYDGLMEED